MRVSLIGSVSEVASSFFDVPTKNRLTWLGGPSCIGGMMAGRKYLILIRYRDSKNHLNDLDILKPNHRYIS